MDTSEEYLLMCKKATEIQEKWDPTVGDITSVKTRNEIQGVVSFDAERHITVLQECKCYFLSDYYNETSIWLPRQDQLMDILNRGHTNNILNGLFDFITIMGRMKTSGSKFSDVKCVYDTMEKLLLSAVMFRKYGKVWTLEEWVGGV